MATIINNNTINMEDSVVRKLNTMGTLIDLPSSVKETSEIEAIARDLNPGLGNFHLTVKRVGNVETYTPIPNAQNKGCDFMSFLLAA